MAIKKPTSFSLSEETLRLLKQLAEKSTRNNSQQLEVLIKEAAIKEGLIKK